MMDVIQCNGKCLAPEPSPMNLFILVRDPVENSEQSTVGCIQINRCNVVPLLGPVDGGVTLSKQLLSKLLDEGRFFGRESVAINVAHGKIYNPAVAPKPTRVQRHPVRQQPKLGGDYIQTVPAVQSQSGQPKLAPRWNTKCCPGHSLEPLAGLDTSAIICGSTKQPVCDIVHCSAEYCAVPFDVQPPATVVIRVTTQIPDEMRKRKRKSHKSAMSMVQTSSSLAFLPPPKGYSKCSKK